MASVVFRSPVSDLVVHSRSDRRRDTVVLMSVREEMTRPLLEAC
jgi:hypothetical protein